VPADRDTLPHMLSTSDVGEITGRSERTVRGWIADGKLMARKRNGRFYVTPDDLSNFFGLNEAENDVS
jgi:hypothetical protein